jgi:hypothetical protein
MLAIITVLAIIYVSNSLGLLEAVFEAIPSILEAIPGIICLLFLVGIVCRWFI